MNPVGSTTFRGDEESRSTSNEDHNSYSVLRSRTEEEKQRPRREWQRQHEREMQLEKLKRQKILEYERKRAQALKYGEEKSSRCSRSKSGSESPSRLRYRDRSASTVSKSGSLHEKLDESTRGTVPLFRGPQNTQIDTMELRRIKVSIHRNIPVTELQRDILNPEDVIIKRREGEGCKPIFDREEIKQAKIKTNEVEKRLVTYVAVKKQCTTANMTDEEPLALTNKSETSRKHSSLSPKSHLYSKHLSDHQSRHHTDLECWDDSKESCSSYRRFMELFQLFMEEQSYHGRYRERSNKKSNKHFHERKASNGNRERNRNRNRNRDKNKDKIRDKDRNRESERKKDRARNKSRE